jgi:type IV secretion system protein VirD4
VAVFGETARQARLPLLTHLAGPFWIKRCSAKLSAVILLRMVWWLSVLALRGSFIVARQLLACLFALSRRRDSHGSARWASWWSMVRAGTWGHASGLIVARCWGGFIRYRHDGAVLVFGPMGSGKGTGIVIPNLLTYPGACIVTDPKGENLAVTGRWRATLGPVWQLNVLDPSRSHRFNPLDLIRTGTHHEADDAAMIADMLIVPESSEEHWDTSSKALVTAIIRHVVRTLPKPLQTLSTVRQLLASDSGNFTDLLHEMANSPIASIAEEGRVTLASLGSDEMTSILKNAAKALGFWSKDRVGGMLTAASDFDLMNMHRRAKTIYIVVPEDKLPVYKPFLRMMMGCALAAAVRGKEALRPAHKPLLVIDECPALGYLEALASGLGYLRAYARTILVFQDLGQLKRIYGPHGARTFIAASGCQIALNVSDNETARDLADSIGTTTVMSRSYGASHANSDVLRHQHQSGKAEARRHLLDASEIRRLPANRCLVFITGCLPLLARKVRHYRVRAWASRWDAWREERSSQFAGPLMP